MNLLVEMDHAIYVTAVGCIDEWVTRVTYIAHVYYIAATEYYRRVACFMSRPKWSRSIVSLLK